MELLVSGMRVPIIGALLFPMPIPPDSKLVKKGRDEYGHPKLAESKAAVEQ